MKGFKKLDKYFYIYFSDYIFKANIEVIINKKINPAGRDEIEQAADDPPPRCDGGGFKEPQAAAGHPERSEGRCEMQDGFR